MLLTIRLQRCMLCCVFSQAMVGCNGGGQEVSQSKNNSAPLVCIRHYPGSPMLGEGVESGIVLEVWQDGRVVRVADADKPGQSYITGDLSQLDRATLESLLANCTTRTADEDQLALDAPFRKMVVTSAHGRSEYAESLPRAQESVMLKVERLVFDARLLNTRSTTAPASGY